MTTYLGIMAAPSGHRLVVQTGTEAFTTSANNKTLTIRFKRPVSAMAVPNQAVAGVQKTKVLAAFLPFISATQFTQVPSYRLVVSRKTGSISALRFSYTVIGY